MARLPKRGRTPWQKSWGSKYGMAPDVVLVTTRRVRRKHMRYHSQRLVPVLMTLSLLFLVVMPVWAADPEIDRLLRSPAGKDWVTNGGNLTNQRYSTLKQIDTSNVKNLKGAWMIRL